MQDLEFRRSSEQKLRNCLVEELKEKNGRKGSMFRYKDSYIGILLETYQRNGT